MKNKTIYLTGAPAAGKSTLATSLARTFENVEVFEFGSRMSDWLSSNAPLDQAVDQENLRSGTTSYVKNTDIYHVNALMRTWVEERRTHAHLIIDSHQVTIEKFGLIYVPFQEEELRNLCIDEVWVVDVEPKVAIDRITRNPKGRALPSEHVALMHSISQMSVATAYGAMKQVPVVIMDGSLEERSLLRYASERLGLVD